MRYKSLPLLYKAVSCLIRKSPLPDYVTVRTKYGTLIVPKSFRMVTLMIDLVEPEVKDLFEQWARETNYLLGIGACFDGWCTTKGVRSNSRLESISFAVGIFKQDR